jgi:hypothetical protein
MYIYIYIYIYIYTHTHTYIYVSTVSNLSLLTLYNASYSSVVQWLLGSCFPDDTEVLGRHFPGTLHPHPFPACC